MGKKTEAQQCAHRPASCSLETEETAWIDGRDCSGGARGGSVAVIKRVRTRRPEPQPGQAIMSMPVSRRKRVHQGRSVGCCVVRVIGAGASLGWSREAVNQWKFRPGRDASGKPIDTVMELMVSFQLR